MGKSGTGAKSIKGKLILLIMVISGTALVLSLAGLMTHDVVTFRKEMVKELNSLAQLIAENGKTALDFEDESFANDILAALKAKPNILSAGIYTGEGNLLANYIRADQSDLSLPGTPPPDGHVFHNAQLELSHAIQLDGETIGTVFLLSDMDRLQDRIRQYFRLALITLAGSAVIVFLLATRMQRVISEPILKLAKTAREISETRDYTLRVRRETDDETGYLVDRFNDMLSQIEKHERQLKDVNEQLALSEQRALEATRSKSEFLANMSHELRTPLTAIIGFSEMLLDEAKEDGDEQRADDLNRIYGPANHLLGLINEILDLAKIEANKMTLNLEDFPVHAVIEDVSDTLTPLAEARGNKLTINCPKSVGQLHADQMKVRQSLFNIMGNANKFTENGEVTLDVTPIRKGKREFVQFAITDTGIGMTQDQLARLFNAFSQADSSTSRKYGGTGLGLVITKHFCEMMGGAIKVTSEPGKGSTFTIRLPRSAHDEPDEDGDTGEVMEESSVIINNSSLQAQSVLVIDDDPNVHRMIEKALSSENFNFHFASRGEEGLKIAKEQRPSVITLDVMMPGLDGWAILAKLKEDPDTRNIPVVMLSIVANQELGFALGASEYLTKPVAIDSLRDCITRYASRNPEGPILILEDDPEIRELTRRLLANENYSSTSADNGVHGIEQLRAIKPCMILLDLMMPVMDGFEFLAELSKNDEWRDIPVVVLTAKELTREDYQKLVGRTEKVFAKDANVQEILLAEIRRVLSRSSGDPAAS